MTTRQQRRAAERQARKEADRAQNRAASVSDLAPTRADVNRQNAQHSTGPKTLEGKAAASRNAFKHALYSKQLVLPGEDPAELDALRAELRNEHQPQTPTEEILVNELAEQFWRMRRMRRKGVYIMGAGTLEELERGFALLPIVQRSMAAAERSFHKALNALKALQKERGFVPQPTQTAEPAIAPSPSPATAESRKPVTDFLYVADSESAASKTMSMPAGFVPLKIHQEAA